MNFVADTYKGCPHGCSYCYAPSFAARGKFEDSIPKFRNFRLRFTSENDFGKVALYENRGKSGFLGFLT
jgi:DNA repair photolyase